MAEAFPNRAASGGLRGRQVLLRAAWDQLQEQMVQLGDHPGVVLTQGPTAVDQHPKHRELLVVHDRSQAGHPGPDRRHRMRIGGVGLAALAGREDPRHGGRSRCSPRPRTPGLRPPAEAS